MSLQHKEPLAQYILEACERAGAECLAIGPGFFAGQPSYLLRTVLARRDKEFVTWRYNTESCGLFSGRYFSNVLEAVDDFRNLAHLEVSPC